MDKLNITLSVFSLIIRVSRWAFKIEVDYFKMSGDIISR